MNSNDEGPEAAFERVNLDRFHQRERLVDVACERQHAQREEHDPGVGARDEVALAGHRALVVGRHDQVSAALAFIGPWEAEVGDPAMVVVVNQPHHRSRGKLNDDRARLAQIQDRAAVGRVGVQRETDVPRRRHQQHARLAVRGAAGSRAAHDALHRNRRIEEVVGLERATACLVLVRGAGRLGTWKAQAVQGRGQAEILLPRSQLGSPIRAAA
jgi:hypothetical protein